MAKTTARTSSEQPTYNKIADLPKIIRVGHLTLLRFDHQDPLGCLNYREQYDDSSDLILIFHPSGRVQFRHEAYTQHQWGSISFPLSKQELIKELEEVTDDNVTIASASSPVLSVIEARIDAEKTKRS